jgi:hypothetical protein
VTSDPPTVLTHHRAGYAEEVSSFSPIQSVVRGTQFVSAPFRPLPNTLIIGGIRCGSTSLHELLVRSGATPALSKEVHYFDWNSKRGSVWYRSVYPLRHGDVVIDSTPSYLCTPGVAARAYALVPNARIVAILRDPTTRLVSHFRWRRSRGHESFDDLRLALNDEPNRLHSTMALGAYRRHSAYEIGLAEWLACYPADRVTVLEMELLRENDRDERDRLESALNLRLLGSFPHSNRVEQTDNGLDLSSELLAELRASFRPTVAAIEGLLGRSTRWHRAGLT